jgi:hypothetical protein
MNNRRRESKLASKIDSADRKQREAKKKETKKRKGSDRSYQGMRPIGDDFSSQNEEAEDELDKVGRGPE